MDDTLLLLTLGFLIIMQAFAVRECIRLKGSVSHESTTLQTTMSGLGSLLDEGLDMFNEWADGNKPPSPMITQAGGDLKQMLLGALMNRIAIGSEHAESTQEREIYQEDPPQTEEEV